MNTASKLSLAVVTLLALGATTVQAQSASIQATATVNTPLTVTGTAPLAFGTVFPGLAKVVAPADANSGRFTVLGQTNAEVSLTFPSLPTNLTGPGSLPIGSYTGEHNNTNAAGGTAFTPSAASTLAVLDATTGNRYIFIGATVTPGVAQAAGAYSGTITMNVVYTGN
jgi:hypothetical protein